jgi:hypothetical protein
MTLPGGGLRLQTSGRLAAQLFDSTLCTGMGGGDIDGSSRFLGTLLICLSLMCRAAKDVINNIRRLPVGSSINHRIDENCFADAALLFMNS